MNQHNGSDYNVIELKDHFVFRNHVVITLIEEVYNHFFRYWYLN